MTLIPERLRGDVAAFDIKAGKKGRGRAGRRITARHIRELEKAKITELEIPVEYLHGRSLAKNVVDEKTGEVLVECNTELSEEVLAQLAEAGVKEIATLYTNELDCGPFISDTLRQDSTRNELEALVEIYRMMRPGRAAHQGVRGEPVPEPVFLRRPLRPVRGWPHEVQPPPGS